MAQIIAIANNKGGCGKTTTAANLAAAWAARGFDVLCVDLDAQSNLTAALRCAPAPGRTSYDALKGVKCSFIEPYPVEVLGSGRFDLLPAVRDLAAVEAGLSAAPDRLTRLASYLDIYRPRYDAILIDTPPAIGVLSVAALYAADAAIIAVQPEFLAARGLVQIAASLDALRAVRPAPLDARVLFTLYDKRKSLHRLTAEQIKGAGFAVLSSVVRPCVALAEAPAAGVDIFRYSPRSNGAADYKAVADEYAQTIKLKHHKHNNQ